MATLAELQAEKSRRTAPQFTLEQLQAEQQRRNPDGVSSIPGDIIDNRGAGEEALGVAETALSIASGIIAEPAAGLAGIGALLPGGRTPTEAIEATRESLTFQPRTEAGQEDLAAVGQALAPVGEAISGAETFLGDSVFEATGSPALAALAKTLPSAALEFIGFKGGGRLAKGSKKLGPSGRAVKRAVVDSAPEIEALKNTSSAIYKELDESGTRIKDGAYRNLVENITRSTKKQGLDRRITPKAAGAVEILQESIGTAPTLTEMDTLRKVAGQVAKSADPTESSLGVQIAGEIDDFLDTIPPGSLAQGAVSAAEIGPKYRAARQLWGRARRSETIQEAITKGSDAASGLENGIRQEFNRIINSKKQSRFFPNAELQSMRDVVKGDFSKNMLKHVGKFGISFDRSGSNLLAFLGGAGGFAGGGTGLGATVVAVGTAAKQLGKQLARKEAAFVDTITRAGTNAEKIAEAYLTAFPGSKRTATDLSTLLSDPTIDITGMLNSANKIRREAAEIAQGRRAVGAAIGAAAPQVIQEEL